MKPFHGSWTLPGTHSQTEGAELGEGDPVGRCREELGLQEAVDRSSHSSFALGAGRVPVSALGDALKTGCDCSISRSKENQRSPCTHCPRKGRGSGRWLGCQLPHHRVPDRGNSVAMKSLGDSSTPYIAGSPKAQWAMRVHRVGVQVMKRPCGWASGEGTKESPSRFILLCSAKSSLSPGPTVVQSSSWGWAVP